MSASRGLLALVVVGGVTLIVASGVAACMPDYEGDPPRRWRNLGSNEEETTPQKSTLPLEPLDAGPRDGGKEGKPPKGKRDGGPAGGAGGGGGGTGGTGGGDGDGDGDGEKDGGAMPNQAPAPQDCTALLPEVCERCCIEQTPNGTNVDNRVRAAFDDCVALQQCNGDPLCLDLCNRFALATGCQGNTITCHQITTCANTCR